MQRSQYAREKILRARRRLAFKKLSFLPPDIESQDSFFEAEKCQPRKTYTDHPSHPKKLPA